MIKIDNNWLFENAGGVAGKVIGWQSFAKKATANAKKEAMLIIKTEHLEPCKKANMLRRLMERWNGQNKGL